MAAKSAKPHKVHILVIEDDKGKREMLLKGSIYSIGRSKECDIRIKSPFVSRHHATLIRHVDREGHTYYRVVDGDGAGNLSANGILINGRKVNDQKLRHGDKVVFGPQIFAIYQHSQRDIFPSLPPDDNFDITLIDPAMILNELED